MAGVDQNQADDLVAVRVREAAGMVTAEGVADHQERPLFARRAQQRPQVGGLGVGRARRAPAVAGAVVRAHAGPVAHVALHVSPGAGERHGAGLEQHGRAARPGAMEVHVVPVDAEDDARRSVRPRIGPGGGRLEDDAGRDEKPDQRTEKRERALHEDADFPGAPAASSGRAEARASTPMSTSVTAPSLRSIMARLRATMAMAVRAMT